MITITLVVDEGSHGVIPRADFGSKFPSALEIAALKNLYPTLGQERNLVQLAAWQILKQNGQDVPPLQ